MEEPKIYDYIIAGAGAAGLSMAYNLLIHPSFCDKKILIIDRVQKIDNDRTWCFWEKGNGLFESCVTQQWQNLKFASPEWTAIVGTAPYQYKMIQGKDFYAFCWAKIKEFTNVEVVYDHIEAISEDGRVKCSNNSFEGKIIFNSALFEISKDENKHHLLQHFKGWYVVFETPILDANIATLMDFDIDQHGDCRFVYVLPTSAHEALVEYTVFSKTLLPEAHYEMALQSYIDQKFPNQKYKIERTEFGVIPMTNANISSPHNGSSIISIGTAGYASKASTGYTFAFIQRQCQQIIAHLETGKKEKINLQATNKFQFYDSVLLNVIATHKFEGWKIFTRLFKKLPTPLFLKFLNEETKLTEDLQIMASVNFWSFTKAAYEEIMGVKKIFSKVKKAQPQIK